MEDGRSVEAGHKCHAGSVRHKWTERPKKMRRKEWRNVSQRIKYGGLDAAGCRCWGERARAAPTRNDKKCSAESKNAQIQHKFDVMRRTAAVRGRAAHAHRALPWPWPPSPPPRASAPEASTQRAAQQARTARNKCAASQGARPAKQPAQDERTSEPNEGISEAPHYQNKAIARLAFQPRSRDRAKTDFNSSGPLLLTASTPRLPGALAAPRSHQMKCRKARRGVTSSSATRRASCALSAASASAATAATCAASAAGLK
eukprot:6200110-Pleurochrysis_carterae.AAC.3